MLFWKYDKEESDGLLYGRTFVKYRVMSDSDDLDEENLDFDVGVLVEKKLLLILGFGYNVCDLDCLEEDKVIWLE